MADVFTVLARDHEEVKAMLAELEKRPVQADQAGSDQLALRKKMTEQLVIEESKHEALEEMYFWPAVREHHPDGDSLADQATGQEQEAKEVLARLDKLAAAGDPVATPAVRSAIFERAISHYAAILQTTGPGLGPVGRPGLLPRRDRRRFFDRMHADFVRYRPPGYRPPAGPRGAKLRLIERGAYWPYEVLEPVNKLRVRARRALAGAGTGKAAS